MEEPEVQQKLKIADVVTALEKIQEWIGVVIATLNKQEESAVRNTEFAVDTTPDGGVVKQKVNALTARVGKAC
jgi:hypothetical protein